MNFLSGDWVDHIYVALIYDIDAIHLFVSGVSILGLKSLHFCESIFISFWFLDLNIASSGANIPPLI